MTRSRTSLPSRLPSETTLFSHPPTSSSLAGSAGTKAEKAMVSVEKSCRRTSPAHSSRLLHCKCHATFRLTILPVVAAIHPKRNIADNYRLDIPPFMSYAAAYTLYNYRFEDPSIATDSYRNLRLIRAFERGLDPS